MRKKIEWCWEKLDISTYRAKTIGGWLVLHTGPFMAIDEKKKTSTCTLESMQFVADRDHEWVIVAPFNPSEIAPSKTKIDPLDFQTGSAK